MLLTIYFEERACTKLKKLIIKPCVFRGTVSTSKTEIFVTLVHWWKLLTIDTKSSIPDVVAVLDSPL